MYYKTTWTCAAQVVPATCVGRIEGGTTTTVPHICVRYETSRSLN